MADLPQGTPVSFDTLLSELTGPLAVEYEDSTFAVATFDRRTSATARVSFIKSGAWNHTHRYKVPLKQDIGGFALGMVKARPVRAAELPVGTNVQRAAPEHLFSTGSWAGLLVVSLLVAVVAVGANLSDGVVGLAGIVALLAAGTLLRRRMQGRPHLTVNGSRLRFADLLPGHEEPLAIDDASDDVSRDRVDQVKADYGTLLTDLTYRIENPALFDVASPTTQAFTTALLQWDDTADSLGASERQKLAAQVALTFDAARSHAELVGLAHAPESARETIATAAKAMRLAESDAPDGELRAARAKAIQLLGSLALYYLPDADEARAMLEGTARLALPGRRTEDAQ